MKEIRIIIISIPEILFEREYYFQRKYKENYNFIRWEYENQEYDFNKEVTGNLTLKAAWGEVLPPETYYDIEFVVDGKTKTVSLSKITEEDLMNLGFEEKTGYESKTTKTESNEETTLFIDAPDIRRSRKRLGGRSKLHHRA